MFDWYDLGDVEALRERRPAAHAAGRKVVPLRHGREVRTEGGRLGRPGLSR